MKILKKLKKFLSPENPFFGPRKMDFWTSLGQKFPPPEPIFWEESNKVCKVKHNNPCFLKRRRRGFFKKCQFLGSKMAQKWPKNGPKMTQKCHFWVKCMIFPYIYKENAIFGHFLTPFLTYFWSYF